MVLLYSIKMVNVLEVNKEETKTNKKFNLHSFVKLESSEAAKKAITQVVLSRIGMAVPGKYLNLFILF